MIGVVGDGPDADAVADAAEADGASVRQGSADAVLDAAPDTVVAVGEAAASALARAGVDAPVLPVAAGDGVGSVSIDRAAAALRRVRTGDIETRRHPVLGARIDGTSVGRALFDAALMTAEPVRISEYAVEADRRLGRFRADGVVIATPAGSHDYARAAGGPVVRPGADVAAVVPVAPFAIRHEHWVVPLDGPVAVTVERDESEVALVLDGREERPAPPGRPVEIEAVDAVQVIVSADG